MKRLAILLYLLAYYTTLSFGQEIVFSETCGILDISSSKKVDTYTGWDNSAPVTFSRTTTLDGYADVRKTAATTNHVWFPTGKSSDLIISNISASNFRNLKLSFEIAAYKLTDANVNKLIIFCNNIQLTLPSVSFTTSKFITVKDITLPDSAVINFKFQFTAENNTNGYRLDNFMVTGEKTTSVSYFPADPLIYPFICDDKLVLGNIAGNKTIEIYSSLGVIVYSARLTGGYTVLNVNLKKGLHLVRVGKNTYKINL